MPGFLARVHVGFSKTGGKVCVKGGVFEVNFVYE